MKIVKNLVEKSKYSVKCPNTMKPTRIVVHETANDASAENEIAYMRRNNNETSFHFAVDDKQIVQGIPLDRNAWHAGDGNGKGNREGIAIEICYSKSGGKKWEKAITNAAEFIAELLEERGWDTKKVTKHQDYSGKKCPHRILDVYGWNNFIALIKKYMGESKKASVSATATKKPTVTYQAYAGGKWLGEITGYNTKNSNGYAGVLGKEISGIRVKLSNGKTVTLRSHIKGNSKKSWLATVTKWDNAANGYSGIFGKPIDCVAMKASGCTLKYRVHVKGGGWLGWKNKYNINDYNNGLAGAYGKAIDAIQIDVV